MMEAFLLLRGISLGLLLGMILVILLRFRQPYALRLLAGFSACLCGYLLAPIFHATGPALGFYASVAFSDATVLLFLLLVQALFEDHERPARRTLIFGAVYLSASYAEIIAEHALGMDTSNLRLPVRLLMLGGALYALFLVVRNWQQDLVEARRGLRLAVVAISGSYVLGVTVIESLTSEQGVPFWVEVANSAGILLSLLVFICATLLLGAGGLLPSAEKSALPATEDPQPGMISAANPELEKALHAMEEDCAYRDMELTIRSLAEQIAIPEHRLRKLINRELDYRNFNDFLNHYRLAEVGRRLADPAEAQVPVLTIAMDAGYRSMTTFNRVFRSAYGLTPTQFRQNPSPITEKS